MLTDTDKFFLLSKNSGFMSQSEKKEKTSDPTKTVHFNHQTLFTQLQKPQVPDNNNAVHTQDKNMEFKLAEKVSHLS